jgi:Aspartyl protease
MRAASMFGTMAVAAGVMASGGLNAAGVEAPAQRIHARVVAGGLMIVPVAVNGTGPHPFLLDTGATSSIVDEALVRELGLPPRGVAVPNTPSGTIETGLVRATLRLGRVEWDGDVLCAPLDSVRAVDRTLRGVVGQDLLRRGNWWLDNRGASLVEDAAGALGAADLGERLPLRWHADRPTIDATGRGRRALRFVLDSAAGSPILFDGTAGGDDAGEAVVTTLDDHARVRLVAMGPLRAGRARIPSLPAAVLPAAGAGRGEDGLLPTALFDGVYFDNREGAVVLNPRRAPLRGLR